MTRRLSSLRTRVYAVIVVVVLTPLCVTWLALYTDRQSIATMRQAVEAATAEVAAGEPVDDAALRGQARVVIMALDGQVLGRADRENATTLRDRIGDLFFGPDGGPRLDDWEAVQPPLSERAEVVEARRDGAVAHCQRGLEGKIAVCVAARRVKAGVVVAERSSPRAIRGLYDLRYALLKLTLYVLGGALLLTAWLARWPACCATWARRRCRWARSPRW